MHTLKNELLIIILFTSLVGVLSACTSSVVNPDRTEPPRPKILIDSSTKADVKALFGTPTEVLGREGEVWVYRNLKPEDVEGLMPFYCGDKPLVFFFKLDGSVGSISRHVPEVPSLPSE